MAKAAVLTEQRSSGQDVANVRAELLGMLGRIGEPAPRPGPAAPAPAPKAEPKARDKEAATAKVSAPAKSEEQTPGCAHCGSLDSWGASSWCPRCGYYPKLGRAGEIVEEEVAQEIKLLDVIPTWFWQGLAGVVAIIGMTIGLEYLVGSSLGFLSLASLIQLSFGLILMLVAHVSAYFSGLRDHNEVGIKGFLLYPPDVWWPVFRKLPSTSNLVLNLAWGLVASVSALSILGPIQLGEIQKEIEARQKKPKATPMQMILGAASQMAGPAKPATSGGSESIDDAMQGFAGEAIGQSGLELDGAGGASSDIGDAVGGFAGDAAGDESGLGTGLAGEAGTTGAEGTGQPETGANGQPLDPMDPSNSGSTSKPGQDSPSRSKSSHGKTPQTPAGPKIFPGSVKAPAVPASDPKTADCVVFGYLSNGDGEIRTVLLATTEEETRPRFVARLAIEDFPVEMQTELLDALPRILTRRPLAPCPYGGQWVEPQFVVTIRHAGWANNIFKDAQVESLERQ
jgi:hypothetical protein